MADLAKRFPDNPIFTPQAVQPTRDDLEVVCVLNPGAFRFQGRVGLIMRVAERPKSCQGKVATMILNDRNELELLKIDLEDPGLRKPFDPRSFNYKGQDYLTTMSCLRVAWSEDGGKSFQLDEELMLTPSQPSESYGLEDCRVELIEGTYHLTYTCASDFAIAAGHTATQDWKSFSPRTTMLPPPNKDIALFPRKVDGKYRCFHRPMCHGNNIWLASSPDLENWGNHHCIARIRKGMWDSERIGAGASPIETAEGWLEIYHGADHTGRYCLGALLLDLNEPTRVIARSSEPIMEPTAPYECKGFYNNCIFTNGHIVDGDTVTLYYGASDLVICGATLSIAEVLATLK